MWPVTNWSPRRVSVRFFEKVASVEDFVDIWQRVFTHRRTPATITVNSLVFQLTITSHYYTTILLQDRESDSKLILSSTRYLYLPDVAHQDRSSLDPMRPWDGAELAHQEACLFVSQ